MLDLRVVQHEVGRPKVRMILERKPSLARRVQASVSMTAHGVVVGPEQARVERVIGKIARGLAAFELGCGTSFKDADVRYLPFWAMEECAVRAFFALSDPALLAEVGSRMMTRVLSAGLRNSWAVVQAETFSYGIECHGSMWRVKIDADGFLAAEVDLYPFDVT